MCVCVFDMYLLNSLNDCYILWMRMLTFIFCGGFALLVLPSANTKQTQLRVFFVVVVVHWIENPATTQPIPHEKATNLRMLFIFTLLSSLFMFNVRHCRLAFRHWISL